MKNAQVVRPLTYMTGMVNQHVQLQNEYLAAENATLRDYLPGKWRHLVWQWRSSLNQAAIVVITGRRFGISCGFEREGFFCCTRGRANLGASQSS